MTAIIAKTTMPTTRLSAATKLLKASTTSPAAPAPTVPACERIRRVVAILSTSRTKVAVSRKLGNTAISSGVRAASEPKSARTATVRFADNSRSTTDAGTGARTTRTARSITTGIARSATWPAAMRENAVGVPEERAIRASRRLSRRVW